MNDIIVHDMKTKWQVVLIMLVGIVLSMPSYAQSSKDVTIGVGETKTLYLPSSITTLDLKSVSFYSNGISYLQVVSYTDYSVTIKAIKAFSSPIVVRCDYRYFIKSGSYMYETKGYYDYNVTIGGGGSSVLRPTNISFASSVKAIDVGESYQLEPVVLPANAEYTLTWSINDISVATVSQDGLLVGKSEGDADLKVMADNGVYAMLRVVVSKPDPEIVLITPSTLSINEGEYTYLSVRVYPSSCSQSVTWYSSNPEVASVSSTGRVTGVKAGTTLITAKASNDVTGRCTVTCKAAVPDLAISDKDGHPDLPAKANITYERTLCQGWNSVCVPFAITQNMLDDFVTGCRLVTVNGLEVVGDEYSLSVEDLQVVPAGVPCLIYAPQAMECKFVINNAVLQASPSESSFLHGSFKRSVIGAGMYKLADDGLSMGVTESDESIVAPFRAYVKISLEDSKKYCPELMKINYINNN